MPNDPNNLIFANIAKGATAQLRDVIERCDDKDTALPIYRELMRLAARLNDKFEFKKRAEVGVSR